MYACFKLPLAIRLYLGRGALDCKDLVAIEAVVMKLLVRNGVKPKGDIIFAATSDEERSGGEVAGRESS